MEEKLVTNCPHCGKVLCKIDQDSAVEVVCKSCKAKYEVSTKTGLLQVVLVSKKVALKYR